MAKQTINIGAAANDGTGDPIRTAFGKVNDNFTEIYTANTGVNTGDQNLSAYATTAAVAAGYQPLDSDLTAIAALTTTAYGRALLSTADAPTLRTAIGLGQTDAPTFLAQSLTAASGTMLAFTGVNQVLFSSTSLFPKAVVPNWSFMNQAGTVLLYTSPTLAAIPEAATFQWGTDLILQRDAAGILAQRNGTAKQTLRIYNTYTSATVYERAVMDYNGPTPNTLRIGTEFLGAGMAANPVDVVVGGVARISIAAIGTITTSSAAFVIGGDTYLNGVSFAALRGTGAGVALISNTSFSDFNRLQLGGTTSAFPAIKRNATGIDIRLADDSAFAPLNCGNLAANGNIRSTDTALIGWLNTRSAMISPADGVIRLTNNAGTSYTRLELGEANLGISRGTGSPEGVVTALVGSLYLRTDGGLLTTLYVKESGTGNTGWAAK